MNKKQNHTKTFLACAIIVLTGIVLTSMVPSTDKSAPKPHQKSEDTERLALKKTLGQYLGSFSHESDWWMAHTPPPTLEEARSLALALSNVSNALQSARSVSPLTGEIAQNFSQFYTSIFEGGVSRTTMEGSINMETIRGKTEVCFFSKDDYETRSFPGLLFYRGDWHAVMIAGVRWSGPLFGGVVYHELYHALQHRNGNSGPVGSEKNLREEVDAHELEILVTDYLSDGKYLEETESILHGQAQVRDERKLLGSLTTNAFFRLDNALGLRDAGASIRGTSVAQHIVTLGFKFIDKRNGTKEDKVALYRWIRKI